MPVLTTITYPAGKDHTCVERLLKDVAEVIAADLGEELSNVRVTVKELPTNRYSVGGVLYRDRQAGGGA
ncbi:hypothetical protein [Oscillibacter sp.]|uniref:hypothetical protein n=1 Tax=Oscillibacter sp. TaxID=1945593 RepID=UPI002D7FFA6B|nr:hypothetical protein [Oscillibacter sp.]